MRILFITSVEKEAQAIRPSPREADGSMVVVSGVGRVNAACAVTETILRHGPFDLVINAGIAGALPKAPSAPTDRGSVAASTPPGASRLTYPLAIGDVVLASRSIYAEEGLLTPAGFQDMAALGFPLGDFPGNVVPGHEPTIERLHAALGPRSTNRSQLSEFIIAPIATVATCSGADDLALTIAARTGALAEAMEGAAALHAARRLGTPAIELRAISNTTGDRSRQRWNIPAALEALGRAVRAVSDAL